MKKLVMSAIMCVALMASASVMAQDAKTTKKEGCCKEKTECKKEDKKACSKDQKECKKADSAKAKK